MIYRLRFFNKDGVEERVDIQKGLATPVIDIEGTDNPFSLSYNNDKGNKSGIFLTSSVDIEIYETSDFNIDNLKTSDETELAVTYYIDNVVEWKGFIIPDFFSIEVRNNPVITMTASDRLGALKNVTLADLPSMISFRELAILCLNKTGLTLPLRTMADFNNGIGINDFFNSKISTQRLSDTKGRSISCYNILSSILTASNSFLVQRSGAWHIINKIQHEAGSGKLYTGATSFTNWSDIIFNFSDISIGGRRTIIPVASTVGVFHEFGGGRMYPENYDFSQGLFGWTKNDGFEALTGNKKFDRYKKEGNAYVPDYSNIDTNSYLINRNYIYMDVAGLHGQPRLSATNIPIISNNPKEVKVTFDVNVTGKNNTHFSVAVMLSTGTGTMFLNNDGIFQRIYTVIDVSVKDESKGDLDAILKGRLLSATIKADGEEDVSNYKLEIHIFGSGSKSSYAGGEILFDTTVIVNSITIKYSTSGGEIPKGNIYKTEKGDNFTKTHDIETAIFGDYLTGGLNGYFYDYPIDDTSSLYNSSNELTSKWTAYNDPEQLPLLQHITRQRSRLFSVAHDLLSAEIEVSDFDPLAIFVSCGKRYTVVSGRFNVLKSTLSVELEEVAFQNASVRDFIYSYFGDGESGIKSVGGISGGGGGGGGTGGGLSPEQLEILSFWKKDPDNPNTIFTEMNAYSKLELSAYGVGDGGGGGGSDYERLDTWADYDSSKSGWVLSALLGNDLNTRVTNLENSGGGGGGGSTVEWGTLTNGYRQLTVEGVTYALAQNTHKHLWADITDKPSTFAPSAHSHGWSEITGKPSTFAPSAHSHGWSEITGKPSTFTPSAHSHGWSEITGKPSTFTPSAHTHSASDISSGTFAIARIPTGTTGTTVALGNHLHTGVYEPVFSKNTAFNKNFGTTSGTVAEGNDSRINNGQTAYGWGNHASAGYALNSALSGYVTTSRIITAGNGLTGGGTLAADRTLTLGTPGTLTAATTNGVTASSHTHAITTTSVGAANTIVQTDATGGTKLNNLIVGGDWKLEQVGTELQLKYNDVVAQRFLLDGSIVGLGEITAYGASTGGEGVSLLRTGGTMTGNLTMSADIIMNSGRAIGVSNLPLKLLGNALTYNASNVLTEANTATQIKMGNGWTIEQTTASLTIRKDGVIKQTIPA